MSQVKTPLEEIQEKLAKERQLSSLPVEENSVNQDVASTTPAPDLTQVRSKQLESIGVQPEPVTDLYGGAGAVIRGLAPTATYTAIGAAMGAPFAGVGAIPGAAFGNIVFPLADLAIDTINASLGTDFYTIHGAVTGLLDNLGTPTPDTAAEKIIEAVSSGVGSGYSGAKAFGTMAEKMPSILSPAQEALKKGYEFLAEGPKTQAAIAGAASAGATAAKELLGANKGYQVLSGITSALAVPLVKSGTPVLLKGLAPVAETIVPSLKKTKLFEGYKDIEAAERLQRIFQEVVPKDPEKREKFFEALSKEEEFSKQGVQMMPGELTGYEPLLATQRVAEKTIPEVAERKSQNLRAIADKVDNAMQPIGQAIPKDTEEYFKSVLDTIENQTKNQINEAKMAGQFESAQAMESAAIRAKEIKEQAEKGILTAEEAFNKTKEEYINLYEKIKNTTEVTAKDSFSENAYNEILKQKNIEKEYLNKLGKAASVDVPPFYQENAIKSYDDLLKFAKGKERRIPNKIKIIINEAINKKSANKASTVDDVIGDLQEINKEIRAANMSPQRAAEIPYFEKFKKSLSKDLEDQEGASENLKKFNRGYRDYSKIYKEGASKEIFKPGAFISKTLDEYIGKSEASASKENIQQLRNAILGTGNVPKEIEKIIQPEMSAGVADLPQQPYLLDKEKLPLSLQNELSLAAESKQKQVPEGIKNVVAWLIGRMSSEISDKAATKSIDNWMTTKGNRILEVFPEAQPYVDDIKSQFKAIEDQKNSAQEAIIKAKKENIIAGQDAKFVEKQAKIESQKINDKYKNQIDQLKDDFDFKLKSELNPANKFFGANVPNLIKDIMSKRVYSERDMQRLVDLSKKDQTGKAYQGLVNGFKEYLNRAVRSKSRQLDDLGIPSLELPVKKLRVKISEMNQLMSPNSSERKIIEMMLGKDSQELAEMDKARQMLGMMEKETELRGRNIEKLIGKTESQLANDLFSIAGIGVGGFKGFVVFKSLDLIRKLQTRTRIDVGERMLKMYADSMLDSKQFRALSTPITEESFPMIQQILKQYGIIARATDFGLEEESKDKSEQQESAAEFPAF